MVFANQEVLINVGKKLYLRSEYILRKELV